VEDNGSKKSPDDKLTQRTVEAAETSPTGWLIQQSVATVHQGDEGAAVRRRLDELLHSRADLVDETRVMFGRLGRNDPMLRWTVLYALSEVLDERAAEFLAGVALSPLPDDDPRACETVRDSEVLVHTMAIEALRRIASRVPDVSKYLLQIVSAQPAQPLLVEAVKACRSLGLADAVKSRLAGESYWMLDLRQAAPTELAVKVERRDDRKAMPSAPRKPFGTSKPKIGRCSCEER
jgi:hypothetical protein